MKKNRLIGLVLSLGVLCFGGIHAQAAFHPDVEAAYNTAVQGQDALDGLDVSVTETTVSSSTNHVSTKEVELKVSGISGSELLADILVNTDEGSSESYFRNNTYYTDTSDGKVKMEMDRAQIWDQINSHIYLDMTSNYLKMLSSTANEDGTVTYQFAATKETLGDYAKKLLNGSSKEQGIVIDALQGTMVTSASGSVMQRTIQMIYTVTQNEQEETFYVTAEADFHQDGQSVSVKLPDLSVYKAKEAQTPVETITPLVQTIYTTEDVNVRAAGDLSAVLLGGLNKGTGVMETGYTSDGWIQIQYNGAAGYIWGEYTSTSKPVLTTAGSGTMYAAADVNIRSSYSSDGSILGVLAKGDSIEITGKTDNGWIRVKYLGHTGYVFADYLSWTAPVVDTYVENGYASGIVTDASFGVLTIRRDDGLGNETFNTIYAQMNLEDTIYTGDWVEVYYYGAGAPYTASIVNDYTSHSDSGEEQSVSVEGVVTRLTPSSLELTGSDGICRTFDITDTDMELSDALYEGKYIEITWMSRTNGAETRNIEALRIRG